MLELRVRTSLDDDLPPQSAEGAKDLSTSQARDLSHSHTVGLGHSALPPNQRRTWRRRASADVLLDEPATSD